jgi:hypothetical protein
MDWIQVLTIAGSTIGACWYMHKENLSQWKEMSKETAKEMKDFHGRLCTLEEKYRQMMERYLQGRNRK